VSGIAIIPGASQRADELAADLHITQLSFQQPTEECLAQPTARGAEQDYMGHPRDRVGIKQRVLGYKTSHAMRDEGDCAVSIEWRYAERCS